MPRAKAPDPLIEDYETDGRTYRIEASKDGGYLVQFEGRTLVNRPSQLGAHFGAPQWPSLKVQAQAMEEAKQRARTLRDDQH